MLVVIRERGIQRPEKNPSKDEIGTKEWKRKRRPTVNPPIPILIRLSNHLIHLVIRQLLADTRHDMSELGGGDEAVVVAVEDLEGLADLLLGVRVLHLARHHGQEFREVNGAVVVGVDLVDHVLQLGFRRVLAQRAHHGAELFGRDLAIAVLVLFGGWQGRKRSAEFEVVDFLVALGVYVSSPGMDGRGVADVMGGGGKTYEEGESLLELADLLLGQ